MIRDLSWYDGKKLTQLSEPTSISIKTLLVLVRLLAQGGTITLSTGLTTGGPAGRLENNPIVCFRRENGRTTRDNEYYHICDFIVYRVSLNN